MLLDRDGTLIAERNYLARSRTWNCCPPRCAGLRLLNHLGLGLAVLTNQSGLKRGYFDRAALDAIHVRLTQRLADGGVSLAGIFVCPHGPEEAVLAASPSRDLPSCRGEGAEFRSGGVVCHRRQTMRHRTRETASRRHDLSSAPDTASTMGSVRADHIVADVLAAAQLSVIRSR